NRIGNRLIFPADDGVHGTELWTTDGTPAGTTLLKDVCPGACSGGGGYLFPVFGNHSIFQGYDPVHGGEPWITDGTPAGTHLIRDLCRGSCSSETFPYFFSALNQAFFVLQNPDGVDHQLWRTDGTARGTFQVANVQSLDSSGFGSFGGDALGNALIFAADDGEHGSELWRSDGTVQGTGLLVDINSRNVAGSFPNEITA